MISQAIKTTASRVASWVVLLLLLLLSAASCVREPSGAEPYEPGIPEGMVKVGLYTGAGDYQTPVSRAAADEGYNGASTTWVFVFAGNDDNAVFAEVKQAVQGVTQPYVLLTRRSSPVRLLIVANAPATFFNGTVEAAFTENNFNAALAGATFATAANDMLNTAKINNPSVIPYTGSYLPMSGALDISEGINENTSIGTAASKVGLRRVVAKVTVENSASGFALSAVSAAGAKQYGRFHQIPSGQNIAGNTTDYDPGIVTTSLENTLANPVYIYESPAGETSVIVRGTYNGIGYFYKLAFKDPVKGSIMAVRRNMWYRFKINSVAVAGYSDFGEAAAGSPSNHIDYTVTVIDQSSYDMADNGQFYMGLSNSEYLIYGYFSAAEQLTIATVTTNAASATTSAVNSVTASGTGLGLAGGSAALNLSADGTTPASTDLKITVASNFTSGTVTVRLGNLMKVIPVVKVSSNLVAFGTATPLDYHTGNQYTSATIGYAASSWLSLSTDGITSKGAEFTQSDSFLPLYLITQDNPQGSQSRQTDDIYLTRRDAGRVKVFVKQSALEYAQISPAYVGTFHRWNETGERVVRIPYSSTNAGNWTALVLSGGDFIKMDDENSTRTYPLTGDAETYQVSGNNKTVRGKSSGSSTPVYFRVGMTGTHPSGSAAATGGTAVPRYGMIALAYAENTKIHLIYVRQGEAASVTNSSVKWSPYNLSDPSRGLGGSDVTDHSLFTPRATVGSNTFSDYPTQVGYLFRWNLYNPGDANSNRAFHVTNPSGAITGYPSSNISTWNTSNDPCPKGYRHPTGAEFVDFAATDLSNSYWGYCADGFFDRLSGGSSYSVTGSANYMYGIYGRLFFNVTTKASVFFPAAGNRIGSTGDRGFTNTGCYSSSNLLEGNVHNLHFDSGKVEPSNRSFATMRALSVRCVAE